MAIIKITRIKDGNKPDAPILFNSNEMITAESTKENNTLITYKRAMVDSFICAESLDEVYNLINNSKNNGI